MSDDLIDGFIALMDSPEDFTGPVNLGNPDEFTIRDLAEAVIAQMGSRSTLSFRPLPQHDPMQRCPDIGLARRELGWEPKVAIKEGLERTVAYFSETLV